MSFDPDVDFESLRLCRDTRVQLEGANKADCAPLKAQIEAITAPRKANLEAATEEEQRLRKAFSEWYSERELERTTRMLAGEVVERVPLGEGCTASPKKVISSVDTSKIPIEFMVPDWKRLNERVKLGLPTPGVTVGIEYTITLRDAP